MNKQAGVWVRAETPPKIKGSYFVKPSNVLYYEPELGVWHDGEINWKAPTYWLDESFSTNNGIIDRHAGAEEITEAIFEEETQQPIPVNQWDKNHCVRLKAWIDKLLEISGLAHIGIAKEDSPARKFLELIDETYEIERETWLDESEPIPVNQDEDYWQKRCEAAEKVIINEQSEGYNQQDYETWYNLYKSSPSPTPVK